MVSTFPKRGSRVASPNDNFLLFSATCKQTHEIVRQFCKILAANCAAIEQRTYNVCGF